MYKLVLINLMLNAYEGELEPYVEGFWSYNNLFDCFYARDELGKQMSGKAGYFPEGVQAVCIPHPSS